MKESIALTHAGKFHADDVFGGAFLRILNPDIKIIRKNEVPGDFKGLVFDIGYGEFDHHQYSNEKRKNGIPYAAFGKLWRYYAPEYYSKYVCEKIDNTLIQDLDLCDNTGSYNALAMAFGSLNSIDEDSEEMDENYEKAVGIAKIFLERLIKREQKHEKELEYVKKAYQESKDKEIIVLDEHYFFQDYLPDTSAVYVIYPSNRGGYCAQGVPINKNTVELKKRFPLKWNETLPSFLKFCHKSGFLITTNTLKEAIHACKEALK